MTSLSNILFAYQKKDSYFHSCDPISKVVWLVCVSISALIISNAFPQFILLLIIVFIALVFAKITPNEAGLLVIVFSVVAIGWFLIQSLLIGGKQILFEIGPLKFAAEGMSAAGAVAFRSIILVLLARIFVGTTEPRELALSFTQIIKLPYSFAFSILLIIRLLPLLEQEFRDLQAARKARGADADIRMGNYLSIVRDYTTILLVRGFRRSIITSYSVDSRAFRAYPNRTYLKEVHITKQGIILSIVSIIFSIVYLSLIRIYL